LYSPIFFTGRKRRPLGIGIEASVHTGPSEWTDNGCIAAFT